MKSYSFAKVSAHGYLTESDYNNQYIITEDLKQIINVSGREFEKPLSFFRERGIIARNMPLTEKNGDMGYKKILAAVGLSSLPPRKSGTDIKIALGIHKKFQARDIINSNFLIQAN